MERCERYTQLLSARMDGELAPQERQELENHLAICPECRALAEQLEALRACMQDMEDVPAPQDFARGVMDRIRGQEQKPKVIPLFRRPQIRALAGWPPVRCCALAYTGLECSAAGQTDCSLRMQVSACRLRTYPRRNLLRTGRPHPGIAAFGTDGSPSERSAGLEAYDAGPGEDGAGSTQDTGAPSRREKQKYTPPQWKRKLSPPAGKQGTAEIIRKSLV